MATDMHTSEVSQEDLTDPKEDFIYYDNEEDIPEHTDEVPKLCPLCNSPIRLFYLNLSEKILSCENSYCWYPFNNSPVVIVRYDPDSERESTQMLLASKDDCADDSEDDTLSERETNESSPIKSQQQPNNLQQQPKILQQPPTNSQESTRDNCKININAELEDIKKLQKEYMSLGRDEVQAREQRQVKNGSLINKLYHLQQLSGKTLLTPEEMSQVKKVEPRLEQSELRIQIDPDSSNINIQLHNPNDVSHVDETVNETANCPELIVIQDEHPDRFVQLTAMDCTY